jgi:hypothetical protein
MLAFLVTGAVVFAAEKRRPYLNGVGIWEKLKFSVDQHTAVIQNL